MNDRELLEYAAKAAGIELDYTIRPDGKAFYHSERNALASVDGGWFAPLTDDGDTLRLATHCEIAVKFTAIRVIAKFVNIRCQERYLADRNAATRRAIVRVAAEIGKQIE